MFKLVISGGDSFTFGSELSDIEDSPKKRGEQEDPSKFSWANLVANKLNAKHNNTAQPGRSNSYITRHVMHEVQQALRKWKPEEIFVQVMWTYTGRHEILVNHLLHEYDRGGAPGTPRSGPLYYDRLDSPWFHVDPYVCEDESKSDWFKTAVLSMDTEAYKLVRSVMHSRFKENYSIGFVDYARAYYKVTGELTDHYISLKEVLFLQEFLENRNVKYMFTYAHDEVMLNLTGLNVTNEYTSDVKTPMDIIYGMRKEIKFDEWFNFSLGPYKKHNAGFWRWASEAKHTGPAKNNKYKLGPMNHPLEEAHKDASELIYDHISNLWG